MPCTSISLSRVTAAVLLCVGVVGVGVARAGQAPASASAARPASPWQASVVNTTRVESWRFFEPGPTGGDPDYAFLANRMKLEARGRWSKAEVTVALQHVGFLDLPERAVGPGPFGTGALYFAQGGRRTNPQQLYVRYANVGLIGVVPGVDLHIGRMAYASGGEAPTRVPKLEAVKGARLISRLVGEFEWSIYQRGYDGARLDVTRPGWQATGVALMPTQGGFARVAGSTMTDVVVAGGTVSTRPDPAAKHHTQVQAFGIHYADRRRVTQRPDNTGRVAPRVDVNVTTVGGAVVGAYPSGGGEFDLFGWTAVQRGDWYEQDHHALAVATEVGYQWPLAPWRPWVRTGFLHASGDSDASDGRHETFFPLVPTIRKFAMTTIYGTMNLRDTFVQLLARPRASLGLRLDVHRLDLASASDLWYAGSGATLGRGNAFGYAGRPSNGSRHLGTSVEMSANYTIRPGWSVNGFLSRFGGGPVVTGTFDGNRAWFAYVENTVSLDTGP
jgi:hypothetical protein